MSTYSIVDLGTGISAIGLQVTLSVGGLGKREVLLGLGRSLVKVA